MMAGSQRTAARRSATRSRATLVRAEERAEIIGVPLRAGAASAQERRQARSRQPACVCDEGDRHQRISGAAQSREEGGLDAQARALGALRAARQRSPAPIGAVTS